MPAILDDKSEHCVPFILERIKQHQDSAHAKGETTPPFFIGLNGVQGAGKTTLVSTLCNTLSSAPYNLRTLVLSIDDLYLPHDQQLSLARSHPQNPLVQHRGQPSTHDIALGKKLFTSIQDRASNIKIPSYDKSAFNGQGDRRPESEWETINDASSTQKVEVIIFEGWCVGFRCLPHEELLHKWTEAKAAAESDGEYKGQLGRLQFENVQFVNEALKDYDSLTDRLDAFMHIDAADAQYVYEWRRQQEFALREAKGRGMSDEQVINFVNGYYPSYELYTDVLRRGIYDKPGKQLRLVVGEDRRVNAVHDI